MTKYDEVKHLIANGKSLKLGFQKYQERINQSNVDKYGHKFTSGRIDKFCAFSATVSLEAYYGNYGSSSCYTTCDVDSSQAQDALAAYMNAHKIEVLDWMGDYLLKKAKAEASKAKEELEKQINGMLACLSGVELDTEVRDESPNVTASC